MKQALRWPAPSRLIVGIGILAAFFVALICYAQVAQAVPPPSTMNFQGRLANSAGSAMPNGSYNMHFRIYEGPSGGMAIWEEVRQTINRVDIQNGLFSVQLGEVTPLSASLFNESELYFEITMPTPATATCDTAGCAAWENPMTPRSKLATSAYAFNAANATELNGHSADDFGQLAGTNTWTGNNQFNAYTDFMSNVKFYGGADYAGTALIEDGSLQLQFSNYLQQSTSAQAFQIQNTLSVNLFTVDTVNNVVRIGSATNDTTAVQLVLDSSNSASDPSGINGAMYYSTSKSKMRCYENGVWKNCDSNTKGAPVMATSNYSAKAGDFVLADADVNPLITITLPAPAAGATVSVKKVSSGGAVTISGGGVNIDGAPNDSLTTQWHSQDYFSDGTKWYKV